MSLSQSDGMKLTVTIQHLLFPFYVLSLWDLAELNRYKKANILYLGINLELKGNDF